MVSIIIFMICLYVLSTLQVVTLVLLFKGNDKIVEVTKNIYSKAKDRVTDYSGNIEYVSDETEYERERELSGLGR